jgi:hypothetical protein
VRALKLVVVLGLVVAGVGVAAGVFRVVDERPDGSLRVAPRISRAAVRWYADRALAAVRSPSAR